MGTSDTSPTPERDEIAALKMALAERDTTVTSQAALIAILEEKLRLATHQQFAPKSEKLSGLGQFDLFFNEAEALGTKPESETQAVEIVVPAHTRERGKRKPIDATLPRKRIEHDIPESQKTCTCGCQKTRIGEVALALWVLRRERQAATSLLSATASRMRRARHWLERTANSDSARLSQLPCFGL